MKASRLSDSQTLAILKQAGNGVPIALLCREHDMTRNIFPKYFIFKYFALIYF